MEWQFQVFTVSYFWIIYIYKKKKLPIWIIGPTTTICYKIKVQVINNLYASQKVTSNGVIVKSWTISLTLLLLDSSDGFDNPFM